MATLTETAFQARQTIKFGTIFIISAIILVFSWNIIHSAYRYFFPAPPPPPEVKFGKLPQLIFDPKPGLPVFTYTLQTPTNELPKFPVEENVYFMPTPQSSFLNLDDATKIARSLGFSVPGSSLSEVVYRFTNPEVPKFLDVNIVNKTLSVSYNLAQDTVPLSLHPQSDTQVLAASREFFNLAGLVTPDLDKGKVSFEYLKSAPEALEKVSSLSEANFVRVNFYRKDYPSWSKEYGNLTVISPRIDRSNVWLLVSGAGSGSRQIIAGEYHYFPVSEDQKSTYPIRTSDQAWADLQAGKGFIISTPPTGNQVVVRRVYLAYYDSGKVQQFLEPVIVFDGDNGFRAIVPAITDQYYGAQ